eukprot:CAMPEP_0115830244 /NCGR_PEP_ID=MMETSP0287-20121206/1519_1 /TAXON_ID=412157 /ORGANISM="Chrysochromulina rotalis, Strain UIO044" /LENGTH=136 /DNA_ID=CAMNT_0003283545 /DNA_START=591 /DNA_END=1001 /DNA_ORIENTATION=+
MPKQDPLADGLPSVTRGEGAATGTATGTATGIATATGAPSSPSPSVVASRANAIGEPVSAKVVRQARTCASSTEASIQPHNALLSSPSTLQSARACIHACRLIAASATGPGAWRMRLWASSSATLSVQQPERTRRP